MNLFVSSKCMNWYIKQRMPISIVVSEGDRSRGTAWGQLEFLPAGPNHIPMLAPGVCGIPRDG